MATQPRMTRRLRFEKGGRVLAVATIFRGRESLLAELAMEQGQQP